MTNLAVRNLTLSAGGVRLVRDVNIRLEPGELVALLGPNGSGKTSLVRGSLGLHPAQSGEVMLGGADIAALTPMERARRVAYLPQLRSLAWPNLVRDVVALGRYSHGAALGRLGRTDAAAVDRAIDACTLSTLAHRRTDTLSGGELARVHCARAFAAETPLLIADEPTAALDPGHQFLMLELFAAYVAQGGGALLVLHDVGLAARYASRLVWMREGRIVADGSVGETLTTERIAEVYGVAAQINGKAVEMIGPV